MSERLSEHEFAEWMRRVERRLDVNEALLTAVLRQGENMALNLDALNAALTDLNAKADAIIAALAAGSAVDQAALDAVVPQIQAVADRLKAATPTP